MHSRPPYLWKRIKPLLLMYYYFYLSFQVLLTNDYKEKIKKTLPEMNSPPELLYQDYNVVMAKTTKTAYKCMTREYKSDRDTCPTTASSSSLACTLVFVMWVMCQYKCLVCWTFLTLAGPSANVLPSQGSVSRYTGTYVEFAHFLNVGSL